MERRREPWLVICFCLVLAAIANAQTTTTAISLSVSGEVANPLKLTAAAGRFALHAPGDGVGHQTRHKQRRLQ